MHADQQLTVISSHIKLKRYHQSRFPLRSEQNHPIFVRFSTVQGGAGSADTVRDSVALPPSSIPKRVFLTLLAIHANLLYPGCA